MIFLSTIRDCPKWVYDHPLKSDDDILDLHTKVCQREHDLWVEYHLEMSEMTITTEVKLILYNQHTKLRRMRQTIIDTLKEEMKTSCFINDRAGYPIICLCKNKQKITKLVHRLVMISFYGNENV